MPPSVVATVMVLQRLEGLSDREAVDRYAFDVRWRYAAGVGGYASGGWARFAHTVLVDMRERLRRSRRPSRIFEVGLDAACAVGLVGRRRVLDSTPLYDAVATMDTVTLVRSALRGLLTAVKQADAELAAALRAALSGEDDYASSTKPQIDWDDSAAREELIDSRARDGFAVLAALDGRELAEPVEQAAKLLATVLGQDLETGEDGVLRIARRVAKDPDPDRAGGLFSKDHFAIDLDAQTVRRPAGNTAAIRAARTGGGTGPSRVRARGGRRGGGRDGLRDCAVTRLDLPGSAPTGPERHSPDGR